MLYIYTQALLGLSTALMPLHNGVWFGLCKQTTYQLVNALTSLARYSAFKLRMRAHIARKNSTARAFVAREQKGTQGRKEEYLSPLATWRPLISNPA